MVVFIIGSAFPVVYRIFTVRILKTENVFLKQSEKQIQPYLVDYMAFHV